MTNLQKALFDPMGLYKEPQDVLLDETLSKEEKLKVLKQWEYDARELMVAEEENMPGDSSNMLQRVLAAIHALDPKYDATRGSATKHGGSSD